MKKIAELQKKIELVRLELNEAFSKNREFEQYYQISTELDALIEEYIERKEQRCI